MDLIKVVEIDDKINLYRQSFPFFYDIFETNLANLPNDFRDTKISICINYIDSIKDWIKEQEPQYLDKIKTGIENIHSFATSSRQKIYLEFASSVQDYFINLPEWMAFSDNFNSLIDRNNGYPICDDLLASNLKQYINPVYIEAINIYEYLLRLVEDQLSYIINELQIKIENLQLDKKEKVFQEPDRINNSENDNKQVDTDQPINYKIHLLNCLGILKPLEKYYKERNPISNRDDFARILKELLGSGEIDSIKRQVSFALKKEEITSHKLKDKLSKTLKDHNLEDKTHLE